MATPFAIVRQALKESRPTSWRESLRRRLPVDALHEILADLAEGKPWMAELPGGMCSAPVLPSSDVRLRAAMFLHEALYGKAVAQTEIQKAESEAKEFEAIRALDDDQLEAEAARILEARKVNRLTAGTITEAEYTETAAPAPAAIPVQPDDWTATLWAATHTEEAE